MFQNFKASKNCSFQVFFNEPEAFSELILEVITMSYYQNSRYLRNTDELEDCYLHLYDIIDNIQEKTNVFRWTIRNYRSLAFGIQYNAHHIRIGKILHRLRIVKMETKFRTIPSNNKLIYVYLGLTPNPAFAKVSITILNSDDEEMLPSSSAKVYFQDMIHRKCYSGFIEPSEFLSNLQHPRILCRITVQNGVEVSIVKANSVLSDMGDLFLDGKFSDLTINVDGKLFQAHSAILAARSPVFEAMLRNEMKEKTEKTLDILDFDADVFRDLLWYLYTGKTKPMSVDLALPLLQLADKYDVKELKSELEEFLRSNISVAQVLNILVAADLCNVENLKVDVLQFIAYNLREVMRSKEWEQFRSHLDLVDDILSYISSEILEY